jgi:hypothetical protein
VAHGRYRLQQLLGEGGMAVVYEATDQVHGRQVALKRLRSDVGAKREAFTALFQQEFLALAELAHPRIVAVYDYGVDEHGPYYTMELLDGGDLRRMAPADHRTACALARDVCSALSLVHSRRMVFRDLSPSNVRRTSDGLAKLIDFGGLAAMGPSTDMVGTLPCVAPEVVNQSPLDARTDLYALGATLYFTLVRRQAYPARDLDELVRLWQQPLRPPSEFVPGIPRALDQLVLDLLQLDPAHRPASAAEVMERLSAIAQLPADESLLVEQAYLATPTLVAREAQSAVLREHVQRAKLGQGASLLLAGQAGVGRSRLLDSAALEAKLAGLLVLRCDAHDTPSEYGALRALLRSLLRQAPKLAHESARPHLALLGHVLPELVRPGQPLAQIDDPQLLQRRLQPALREWLCSIAQARPLLVGVDDVDRIDASSAACFALLAREVADHPLLLVTTRSSGGGPPKQAVQGALHILTRASLVLKLSPLDIAQSEELLGSVFGEVPHLALTALHIQRVTGGAPRDIIRLARHLVSESVIRYEAGAWSLPARLSATDLPASMADALEQRVQKLSAEARALAYALQCEPSLSFSLEVCAALIELPPARTARCLEELLGAELVQRSELVYRASVSAAGAPLAEALEASAREHVHLLLAHECERRDDTLRSAQHLLRAGLKDHGVDALVHHALESVARTVDDGRAFSELLRSLPDGWLDTYREALEHCARAQRPEADKRALLRRVSGLLAHAGGEVDGNCHLQTLLEGLAQDAGLDLLLALPDTLDPVTRAKTALAQAGARTQAKASTQRGLDPGTALQELARQTTAALGVLAFNNSFGAWLALPTLAPFGPLSPAIRLVHELSQGVGMRIGGRTEEALAIYGRILDRLAAPDHGGLEDAYHFHTQIRVMGAIGKLEASMGRASCLTWAERTAQEPAYESSALSVQQLYHLFQGDAREARRIEQRIELLRLQSDTIYASEAHSEFNVLYGHALVGDLTGVKRSSDSLMSRAKLHPAFRAAYAYGRGEYQRIRGDHTAALVELEGALALMRPGEHVLWAPAAAAHVRTLLELGRIPEARAQAESYLSQGNTLGYLQNQLRIVLSLALGKSGEQAEAVSQCEQAIEQLTSQGIGGVHLALAYEARAQLATQAGDELGFRRFAALYSELWPQGSRNLSGARAEGQSDDGLEGEQEELDALSQFRSSMESCQTFFERARTGLEFLGRRAGALGGVLFTRTEQGLVRTAAFGEAAKDQALDTWATEFFKREVTEHVTEEAEARVIPIVRSSTPPASTPPCTPVLLAHDDAHGYAFTGVALFIGQEGRLKRQSPRLIAELSRSVGQMGEVSPEYL